MRTIFIKRLSPRATIPVYQTAGAACFDLAAAEGALIWPGDARQVRTGLAVSLQPGHAMLIFSRSGHGFKHGIRLANCVGVIDSDYRGEIVVALHNDSSIDFEVGIGDRIAQAMVIATPMMSFCEVLDLDATARGESGFGSTGI